LSEFTHNQFEKVSNYFNSINATPDDYTDSYEQQYQDFLATHGKSYATEEEFNMRLGIFIDHLKFNAAHDPELEGHTVGLNEMSDWTHDEFGIISGRHNVRHYNERY
jgi:hypothetical protein